MDQGMRNDHANRKNFAFLSLAGQHVSVHTVDGCTWEGVFVGVDEKASEAVVLFAAVRTGGQTSQSAVCHEECFIPMESIMSIDAIDIKIQTGVIATEKVAPCQPKAQRPENPNAIQWDEDVMLGDFESEAKNWKAGREWDQFAENEKRFGVRSNYSEELYTTKLNIDLHSAENIKRAERLAREIENSGTSHGIQHRIERGEDVELDEGELYSDVKREAPQPPQKKPVAPLAAGSKGSYVPPSKRKELEAVQVANGSAVASSQQPQPQAPQPVVAAPSPSPAPAAPATSAAPQTVSPQIASAPNVVPESPGASASESSKHKALNVGALPFVPGGVGQLSPQVAPVQTVDFGTAFMKLARDLITKEPHPRAVDAPDWYTYGQFPVGYQGAPHQSFGSNLSQTPQISGFARNGGPRGRGGMGQPQQPSNRMMMNGAMGGGIGGGGMNGGINGGMMVGMSAIQHQQQQPIPINVPMNPPQPLDSDSNLGPRGNLGSAPPPEVQQEAPKPRMKRGR